MNNLFPIIDRYFQIFLILCNNDLLFQSVFTIFIKKDWLADNSILNSWDNGFSFEWKPIIKMKLFNPESNAKIGSS